MGAAGSLIAPQTLVLAPSALLGAAAVLGWLLWLRGRNAARWVAAAAAWLALLVLVAGWAAAGRVTVELNLPGSIAGAPLALRMDAISVAFGLVVLLPTALLFTFQPRSGGQASLAALATSAALLATACGSVLLTAVTLGTCAGLVLLALRAEEDRPVPGYWISLAGAWLLLLWGGTVLEVTGGTSVYSAAPVTALRVPVFLLLAVAGLLCSGLLPWPTWLSGMWTRGCLEAGATAVTLLVPLGFLLLTRAYVLGAGHWPSPILNLLLAALGAATAVAAALRAQASADRPAFLGETVIVASGLALMALAIGTPLGVSAAVLTLLGSALVIGLVPALSAMRRPAAAVGAVLAVGVPPSLAFGGRVVALQSGVEAGAAFGFLALAGLGAWLLTVACLPRFVRLEGTDDPDPGSRGAAYLGLALGLFAGVGLGVLDTLVAVPVAQESMGSAASALTGSFTTVVTASGGWGALTLGSPLLILVLVAALLTRSTWSRELLRTVGAEQPPPLFELPAFRPIGRLALRLKALALPGQYRSLLDPRALEAAATSGRPWFWAAVTLVLVVAVTR